MATKTEILQGQVINTYLAATHLRVFANEVYFVDGVMQPAYEWLWEKNGKLSSGERLVFKVSKEVWTWEAEVKILDLCNTLSLDLVILTCSLYQAWKRGDAGLVAWIAATRSQP